jgi:hypothetical protein
MNRKRAMELAEDVIRDLEESIDELPTTFGYDLVRDNLREKQTAIRELMKDAEACQRVDDAFGKKQ